MSKPFIEIRDITKIYKTDNIIVEALKGISFDIFSAEIVSLLGVNGAGKTTLSSILATLHPPTSGNIYFEGKSIYENILDFRMALGYCPQKPNLDPYLTVEQNLVFAGRYYLVNSSTIKKRVEELLNYFDLEKYRKQKIQVLSGGYKQRLLLARALMHEPKFIILDEPTAGLDPHIRRELWQKIKDLKSQGVTILITTHYLEEAEVLSDRVCILDGGTIRLIDKPENLKTIYKKGTLEDVFLQLMSEESKASL